MYSLHIVTFTILSNHERVNENAVAAATVFFLKRNIKASDLDLRKEASK